MTRNSGITSSSSYHYIYFKRKNLVGLTHLLMPRFSQSQIWFRRRFEKETLSVKKSVFQIILYTRTTNVNPKRQTFPLLRMSMSSRTPLRHFRTFINDTISHLNNLFFNLRIDDPQRSYLTKLILTVAHTRVRAQSRENETGKENRRHRKE